MCKDLDFYNCLTASNKKGCVLNNDPATTFPLSDSKRLCGLYQPKARSQVGFGQNKKK